MIYVLQFKGWVKFGWALDWPRRGRRGFWHLRHPPELCGKLEEYEVVRVFRGGSEELEKSLHRSLEGRVGEFHPERDLVAILEALEHLEVEDGAWERCERVVKQACCGGTVHRCFGCDMKFSRREHLVRHVRNIHNK